MNIKKSLLSFCQNIGAAKVAPTKEQTQMALFLIGVTLLSVGLQHNAWAEIGISLEAAFGGGGDTASLSEIQYDDSRIQGAVATVFAFIEGSFGALIMVVSGLGAILSSAFGQYKAALGCLIVAVGAFILRSFVNTFFNVEAIREE